MTEQLPASRGFGADGHLTDAALAILADPRLSDDESSPTDDAGRAHQADDADQREHLDHCASCRAACAATERVLQALRDPAVLHEPPAELWDRIAAEVDPDQAAPLSTGTPMATVTELQPRRERRERRNRRDGEPQSRRLWIPLAAAAAGAVLGGAAMAALLNQQDDPEIVPPVASATVLGDATLEPVAADDFSGRAEMVETEQGERELTVEITAAPDPEAGYFEVWLRDADATRLISLGVATAESSTFTVPEGVDLGEYPVVDVSHEHFDGDPGHSGVTLAAGPMEQADS